MVCWKWEATNAYGKWWLGVVGQIRPKKLISNFVSQLSGARGWEFSAFQNLAKDLLDKSIYSQGLFSEILVTDSSALILSSEKHGEREGRCILFYQCLTMTLTKTTKQH